MTVFISYNHNDSEFAERLALALASRDIKVWKDSWRIGVGDSLIQKVQHGLEGARFFCIVFSKHSSDSEWMKREITASLLLEIENRQVMILPIVIDDTKLSLLVRDKLYADFRGDFEQGLKKLLEVILPHYQTQTAGRLSPKMNYYIDYSGTTTVVDARLVCEIDIVSFDLEEPYSILTQVRFDGLEGVSLETLDVRSISEATDVLLRACISEFAARPATVSVSPGKKTLADFTLHNKEGELLFNAHLSVRIVGDKRKGSVAFNIGALFSQIDVPGRVE